MMKREIQIFMLVILIFTSNLLAQTDNDFPSLTSEDVQGGNILRAEYFTGDALWGLINGGADVYLEYGFDKLLLQEIELKGINFRVEFYRMSDPTSAFGIFSVSHFKCSRRDTLSKYVCFTPFQIQCALGRFYVSIANDNGTKEAEQLTIDLFEKVLMKNKEKLFEIPEIFSRPEFAAQIKNLKVIKGSLGFQNGFPTWSDKFEKFSKYVVYLLPSESGKDYFYSAIIKFSSNEETKKFISVNAKTKLLAGNELLFFESNVTDSEVEKIFLK